MSCKDFLWIRIILYSQKLGSPKDQLLNRSNTNNTYGKSTIGLTACNSFQGKNISAHVLSLKHVLHVISCTPIVLDHVIHTALKEDVHSEREIHVDLHRNSLISVSIVINFLIKKTKLFIHHVFP